MLLRTRSLEDTHAVAGVIARQCRSGDVVVLSGEMGAGKTAFAQGFGRALGIDEPITSPTFTLVHTYRAGRIELHHADLYRLDRTAEVADLALAELVEYGGILLVEWGDVVSGSLGAHLEVHLAIDTDSPEARWIEITAVGTPWAERVLRLEPDLESFRC